MNNLHTHTSQDVLRGAADEVLSVLKSKDLKDPEKQAGVEELLGPLSSDKMAQLVAISKLITDWVSELFGHWSQRRWLSRAPLQNVQTQLEVGKQVVERFRSLSPVTL